MSGSMIKILDPTAPLEAEETGLAPRMAGLGGKALGIHSDTWRSFDVMAGHFEEIAKEKYEIREVMRTINPNMSSPAPQDTFNMLVAKSDAAIVGLGH